MLQTLRSSLGVKCLLGLTATATHETGLAVARQLGVAEEDIVWGAAVPGNLHISVSRDEDRDLVRLCCVYVFTIKRKKISVSTQVS